MFFPFEEIKKGRLDLYVSCFKQRKKETRHRQQENWTGQSASPKSNVFFVFFWIQTQRHIRGVREAGVDAEEGRANSVDVHFRKLGLCVSRGSLTLLWVGRLRLWTLLSVHRAILFGRSLLLWRLYFGLGFGDDMIASRIQLLYNDEDTVRRLSSQEDIYLLRGYNKTTVLKSGFPFSWV